MSRTWCSSAKRENFNNISHFNTHFVVLENNSFYLVKLSHTEYNNSNTNTKLALRARTQVLAKQRVCGQTWSTTDTQDLLTQNVRAAYEDGSVGESIRT